MSGTAGGWKYSEPVTLASGTVGLTAAAFELMRPNGLLKLWLVKGFPKVQKGFDKGKLYLRENAPGVEQTAIGSTQFGIRSLPEMINDDSN